MKVAGEPHSYLRYYCVFLLIVVSNTSPSSHDIAKILLKVALNTIKQKENILRCDFCFVFLRLV